MRKTGQRVAIRVPDLVYPKIGKVSTTSACSHKRYKKVRLVSVSVLNGFKPSPLSLYIFVKTSGVYHVEKKVSFLVSVSDINIHNAF